MPQGHLVSESTRTFVGIVRTAPGLAQAPIVFGKQVTHLRISDCGFSSEATLQGDLSLQTI